MRVRTICLILAFGFCGVSVLAQGQSGRPVFRSGVELIQIDVSVLDAKRQPITGLTAADFTILENGVPRPVRVFNAIELPAPRPVTDAVWNGTVAPDVATNDVGAQDGRLVIILMDRTIPPGQPTVAARKIAEAAVQQLGPHDLAALISTSGGVPQTFTSDKERLLRTIRQRDWSTDMSQDSKEMLAALSAQSVGPSLAPDPLSDGRCLCGLCVLDTVTRLADAVRDATARRKTLLFIGSSLIVQAALRDPQSDVGCDRLLRDSRAKMFDALDRSSLTVHSLDPNGVVNVSPATRASSPLRAGRVADVQQEETNEFLANQESLGILPDRTGGRRVINTNAPEEKVPEIFRESSSYYVLAFEPGSSARGGATRSIEVKVSRKGARVYTQKEYAALRDEKAAPPATAVATATALRSAMGGLIPVAARPLALEVSSFAGVLGGRPLVNVTVDATSFARVGASVPVDVAVVAFDMFGRQIASARQTSTLVTTGATTGRVVEAPVQTHFNLPPGDYEIRAAISDPATGIVSSVFAQVVVSPLGTLPLSLSDVVLESTPLSAITGTVASAESIVATSRRVFGRTAAVRAFLQVYPGPARTQGAEPIAVKVRILDASGAAVHEQLLALREEEFKDGRSDVRVTIPVERLPVGEYLLDVDAAAGKDHAQRRVRFSVQ